MQIKEQFLIVSGGYYVSDVKVIYILLDFQDKEQF